jgi:multiple sugar transport system permease protein
MPKTKEIMKKPSYFSSVLNKRMRGWVIGGLVTMFALILLLAWLAPFGYMISTSLKTQQQISDITAPLWPAAPNQVEIEGQTYDVFTVPVGEANPAWFDGNGDEVQDPDEASLADGDYELAIVERGRESSKFVDPNDAEVGAIHWVGRWRTLSTAWRFEPQWQNYAEAWELPSRPFTFATLLYNTFAIAVLGIIGTVISCTLVAYGFSRFRIPGKGLLFGLLVSTIFLPRIVVTVPTYALFIQFGWVGTWLPLILPHFFANAYNVFWLRQYLMTIPREMDEAAMIDGAGPLQILWFVIIPQIMPAIITVALFHMVFAFRDFFEPLIYLSSRPELQPISVGVQQFNALFGQRPELIQTMALLGLILPVLIFFVAQRAFTRGIVYTGVDK